MHGHGVPPIPVHVVVQGPGRSSSTGGTGPVVGVGRVRQFRAGLGPQRRAPRDKRPCRCVRAGFQCARLGLLWAILADLLAGLLAVTVAIDLVTPGVELPCVYLGGRQEWAV